MDGFDRMSRDELRSIVSKLKIMKYRDMLKLRKNELINAIKFKEIFPFDESFFDDTIIKKPIITKDCPICLDNIPNDKKLILKCKHYFHILCIYEWLKEHNTCPICRDKIFLMKTSRKWLIDTSEEDTDEKIIFYLESEVYIRIFKRAYPIK